MSGIEWFWTLVCYAVLFGLGAVGAFVGYYWFVEIPKRELARH